MPAPLLDLTAEDAELILDGEQAAAELKDAVDRAELTRTTTGPSIIEMDVDDPAYTLLRDLDVVGSRRLSTGLQLGLLDLEWVCSELEKTDDGETLSFYDPAVATLKTHEGIVKASRDDVTRAQFVQRLCRKAGVAFNALGSEDDLQAIASLSKEDEKALRDAKASADKQNKTRLRVAAGALSGRGLKFQHQTADRSQLRTAERVQAELDKLGIKPWTRVRLVATLAPIGESAYRKEATDYKTHTHKGPYQSNVIDPNDVEGQVRAFVQGGDSFRAGGAIAACREHPDWSPGTIVSYVEISDGSGGYYDSFLDEARALLRAWTPGSEPVGEDSDYRTGTPDRATVDRYEFRVQRGENWWDCIVRLAEEVGWRAFAVNGVVFFVADTTLARQDPAWTFAEPRADDPGEGDCLTIRWKITRGNRVDTVTVRATATPQLLAGLLPGCVVVIRGEGEADGRWLCQQLVVDLLEVDADVVITLAVPQKPKPEPASTVTTVTGQEPASSTAAASSTSSAGGTFHDVKGLTPKQIIDRLVLPVARKHGIQRTVAQNDAGNAAHGPVAGSGARSDHQGPPDFAWAADMSNGTSPTQQMDALAKDLAERFGITWTGSGAISATHNGFRFQLIYRSMIGGNHYNHVHLGVRVAGTPATPASSSGPKLTSEGTGANGIPLYSLPIPGR